MKLLSVALLALALGLSAANTRTIYFPSTGNTVTFDDK